MRRCNKCGYEAEHGTYAGVAVLIDGLDHTMPVTDERDNPLCPECAKTHLRSVCGAMIALPMRTKK